MIALLAVALGAVPDGLRPALAPADAPARWAETYPEASPLACDPVLEQRALLCFRVWEGKRRRYVTRADLAAWQTDLPALVQAARQASAPRLDLLTRTAVVDLPDAWYWIAQDADGWAVAALLHPEAAAARVGGEQVRIAVPRAGLLLAWPAGSEALDRVMTVAARELYDSADDAVSPMGFVLGPRGFLPWAQATPRGG